MDNDKGVMKASRLIARPIPKAASSAARIYRPMRSSFLRIYRYLALISLFVFSASIVAAQVGEDVEYVGEPGTDWFFWGFLIVAGCLIPAIYLWLRRGREKERPSQPDYQIKYSNYNRNESYEMEGLDADAELEWLRKVQKTKAKPKKQNRRENTQQPATVGGTQLDPMDIDTRAFQEKMRRLQYIQLPINSFTELKPARPYEPLKSSNETPLLSAIEQANEEFEEDESVRELAVRVLAAYKTKDSVESLAQIALYDLSSNLRSKAVAILTDFDHETVFETLLLACADPTREVRAAAARGLFKLGFDRADAWTRIVETDDEYRMRQAARAAIEAGIVIKSFDRLVHEDLKVAYEAFALVALLIKAGESELVFEAIQKNRDERVRFALLHVLGVLRDERSLRQLVTLNRDHTFPTDVADRLRDTILRFEHINA